MSVRGVRAALRHATSRYHPGGFDEILRGAGKDCTDAFDEIHQWVNVDAMLRTCVVGKLSRSQSVVAVKAGGGGGGGGAAAAAAAARSCLDLVRWAPVTLLQKTQLTPTCMRFRFGLPSSTAAAAAVATAPTETTTTTTTDTTTPPLPSLATCGGCPGQHLELRFEGGVGRGKSAAVVREYTPVSPLDQPGSFDIDVRIYPRPAGRMGQFLAALPVGAQMACRGMQVASHWA